MLQLVSASAPSLCLQLQRSGLVFGAIAVPARALCLFLLL